MSPYNRGHEITGRESVGTTLRTRRSLWAVALSQRGGRQLPLQTCWKILRRQCGEDGVDRRKSITECVQGGIRVLGI